MFHKLCFFNRKSLSVQIILLEVVMPRILVTYKYLKLCFILIQTMKYIITFLAFDYKHTLETWKLSLRPETNAANKITNANIWRKIGILLQSAEIGLHVGGGYLQYQALEAFNHAIRLNDGVNGPLDIQVYFFRGIVLKTIGDG